MQNLHTFNGSDLRSSRSLILNGSRLRTSGTVRMSILPFPMYWSDRLS